MEENAIGSATAEAPKSAEGNMRSLRQFSWIGLVLLVVQSVTGLILNLYVNLPIPGGFGQVFVLNAVLTTHILNAFLLVVGGILLLRFGWRTRAASLRWLSIGAFLSVILGVQEGFAFTFTQDNAFSFGMEIGFLGAMMFCGTILYLTNDAPRIGNRVVVAS